MEKSSMNRAQVYSSVSAPRRRRRRLGFYRGLVLAGLALYALAITLSAVLSP
jgi:hypothetical protein